MLFRLIVAAALVSATASFASDNYDTLTRSVIRCVVNRDSAGIAALLPGMSFRYFIADVRTDKALQKSNKNFMVQADGYYPYEKKRATFAPANEASFLASDCGASFSRTKYPVAESDFSQVNIEGKNRVEIVCRALCGTAGVHFVFVKNKKMAWGFAGVWWEKVRAE
jgi:hypothetical protein